MNANTVGKVVVGAIVGGLVCGYAASSYLVDFYEKKVKELEREKKQIEKNGNIAAYIDGFENGAQSMKKHQINKNLFD